MVAGTTGGSGDIIYAVHFELPKRTKAEKALMVGPVGMVIYDTTANKISVKTNAATAIGSWELVTSVADS
ncbi:MAG: hypothetical protein PHV93_04710 [Candidatus Pacebacteria bacterium]|nr:hypothetical protein [Candidatus Paceibacterota bacterium]